MNPTSNHLQYVQSLTDVLPRQFIKKFFFKSKQQSLEFITPKTSPISPTISTTPSNPRQRF